MKGYGGKEGREGYIEIDMVSMGRMWGERIEGGGKEGEEEGR